MQYKTIVLEMLKERKELHEQLRLTRRLRPTMEACATELKASHESWKQTLSESNPASDPVQISSEAMELALTELEDRLPNELTQDDRELPTLDGAMAYLVHPTLKR